MERAARADRRGGVMNELAVTDAGRERMRARETAAIRRRRRTLQMLGIRIVSVIVVLALWQYVGSGIDPVLFTTPLAVIRAAYQMILSGELWTYLWPSLVIFAAGLSVAAVIGVATGLLLARYWVIDVAVGVYITFLYSIPAVALVPLIVLWAGFESTAKIIVLFLFAFFPMAINTYQGVKNVDPRPIAVGRGLVGMVLADQYTAISGVGYLIVRTPATYQVDKMFVPIVTLGILGITLTALLRVLERYVAPWTLAGEQD